MNHTTRYLRLKDEMSAQHFDAMVAVSPENVFYMAQTYIETQKSLRDRLAIALLPLEQDPVMIACVIEQNTVEAETWIQDRRYYVEFQQSPIQFLAQAIRERGLSRGRVGIELDYLSALWFMELNEALPDVEFVPCVQTFERLRSRKDKAELDLLTRAAQSTLKAFETALEETAPGDTERQLGNRTAQHMLDLGCDKVDFLMMGTGPRSLMAHALPDDSPLALGEVGRIDFGGLFGNYNSDVARTFTIGKPAPKQLDIFQRMTEVYLAAISSCQIGVPVNTPYLIAQQLSKSLKLPFSRVHEGHGLGIGGHEHPILSPNNTALFEEDMVLCVEHAVHVDGRRYHVEDLIHITRNGPMILSDPDFRPRLLELV